MEEVYEEDSSDEECTIIVYPLPTMKDCGACTLKHTSKQLSDLRAHQNTSLWVEPTLFDQEHNIVEYSIENLIDHLGHKTETRVLAVLEM